jgi:hypothetical protein
MKKSGRVSPAPRKQPLFEVGEIEIHRRLSFNADII